MFQTSGTDHWDIILKYLDCSIDSNESEDVLPNDFTVAISKTNDVDLYEFSRTYFIESYTSTLRNNLVPSFWGYFPGEINDNNEEHFCLAVNFLNFNLKKFTPYVKRLLYVSDGSESEQNISDELKLILKGILFSQIPLNHDVIIKYFYNKVFKVYHTRQKLEAEFTESILECSGCSNEMNECYCDDIWNSFQIVNQELYEMGLLERLAGDAATQIMQSIIEEHIQKVSKGNYEESFLISLEDWLSKIVMKWLSHVYYGENERTLSEDSNNAIESFKVRLSHFLWETYANVRIEELFNIIIEFPESQPAIEDLRDCLRKTNLRQKLIQVLKSSFETRLLHPGVSTSDVLTAYISAIKALRVLDSSGVILQLVCEPLRKYLKTRDDTVRWIVFSLTDDSSNELADELTKGEPLLMDENQDTYDEMEDWESWQPDPVDADPSKTSKSRKSSDIISTLVNIYGSKELFVREYRTLLADRILSQFPYDTQKELRYMELLKLRFGESELHLPEVMLKDVVDSKRINSHIHSEKLKNGTDKDEEFPVNAMILSARFWPSFKEEKLELPEKVQSAFSSYMESYEALKGNRTLKWKSHLGLVNLEIEIKDKKIALNVSPILATIIIHFENKSHWTIDELSSVMKVPNSMLRRKMAFWQSQGIITEESPDVFVLLKEQKYQMQDDTVMVMDDEEETESAMASSHDQREEELQVFWSYIVGMLTNLESLPLERMHSMLKMFAMQGPSAVECSLEELKHFLDRKVKDQKLTVCGEMYRLPKSGS